jgi:bifunctional non-homologous end joining protein LigD
MRSKYDGYRMIAAIDSKGARFYSRNRLEWTDRFRTLAGAVEKLNARDGILNGEIVEFDHDGRSDFGMMQQVLSEGGGTFYYIAFHLLHVNGKDYRAYTLLERKARLRQLIHGDRGLVRYIDHLEETARRSTATRAAWASKASSASAPTLPTALVSDAIG